MSVVVPNILCDLCESLFDHRASWQTHTAISAKAKPPNPTDGWQRHLCLKALNEPAGNGCHSCSNIWFSIEDGLAGDAPEFMHLKLNELEHFKAGESQLWVRIVYKTSLS